jgi:ribosomal protein L18
VFKASSHLAHVLSLFSESEADVVVTPSACFVCGSQVIDDVSGRTLAAASTLTADVKSSVEGNGANVVSCTDWEQGGSNQAEQHCVWCLPCVKAHAVA